MGCSGADRPGQGDVELVEHPLVAQADRLRGTGFDDPDERTMGEGAATTVCSEHAISR